MRIWGSRFGVLVAVVLVVGPALAADPALDPPLMVAAEIDPGLGIDARAVREAIGAELHRTITAPAAGPSVDLTDVLLVSMTRERTVVSFRAQADGGAARAIPTPAERVARLRAVAWLAGNLARDQVSPLVMSAAKESPVPPRSPAEPSSSFTATAPPALLVPTSDVTPGSGNVLALHAEAPRSTGPGWLFSFALGAGLSDARGTGGPRPVDLATAWQAEAQRRLAAGWLLGGAIDYGPSPSHRLGYAVTGGIQQRWRAFRFEETLGLGFDTRVATQSTTVTNSSLTGANSQTTVSSGTAPYFRVFVSAAYPLARSWDAVLHVGAHSDLAGTLSTAYLASSLGVRLSLP